MRASPVSNFGTRPQESRTVPSGWPSGTDAHAIGASPDGDMVVVKEGSSIRIRSLTTGEVLGNLTNGLQADADHESYVIGSPSRAAFGL